MPPATDGSRKKNGRVRGYPVRIPMGKPRLVLVIVIHELKLVAMESGKNISPAGTQRAPMKNIP